MREAGQPNEELEAVQWEDLGYGTGRAETMDKTAEAVGAFFAERTRDELVRECAERRIMLFPVATAHDIYTHPQLEARGYFTPIEHPELGASVTYPGLFIQDEEGERVGLRRRPPLIGEHNQDIFCGEVGLSLQELCMLAESRVI